MATMVWLVLALASRAVAGDIYITGEVCKALPSQAFAFAAVPANLPSADRPAGVTQISAAAGFAPTICPAGTGNTTRCLINVDAWATSPGATVWVKPVPPEEPVAHELNRIWVHDSTGALLNPTSKHCADFAAGTKSEPGAKLVLTACGSAASSSWVYSTTDRTLSQKSAAGGYPGLCLTMGAPAPGPSPPPPPPPGPPLPATITVGLMIPDTSNSRTSASMASFNFDWHANSEEPPFWINASAQLIDLESPLLQNIAKAMAPSVLRLGGSEGDVVCYDVPEFNSTCASMNQTDPEMCLTMPRYEKLASFAANAGLRFVFGLNAVWGRKDHDLHNPLGMVNIEALLAYTAQHGVKIWGFEVGNEKCGPPPALFAADYHRVHTLLVKYWPEAGGRPKLIGNDCNTNPSYLTSFLPLVADILDVTTYHRYDGYGLDPKLVSEVMTPAFLDKTVSAELNAVHAKYAPDSELWVGEAAAAWHSGRAGVTNAFESSFWWGDALGALAAHNHTGYCRQTLIGGSYGLLNRTNYNPNPDFYVAQLFHNLMGDVVLSPTVLNDTTHGHLRMYANCNRNGTGATLLVLNVAASTTITIVGSPGFDLSTRDEFVLTAEALDSRTVALNGKDLVVSGNQLPALFSTPGTGDALVMAPQSIAFVVLPGFKGSVCSNGSTGERRK